MKDELERIYPRLLKPFIEGSTINAAPVTFSTVYPVYNRELFMKFGVPEPNENWTWEDFLTNLGMITRDTDGDGIVDLYGLSFNSTVTRWLVFLLRNGVDFSNIEENPELLANALEIIHNLLYRLRIAKMYPRSSRSLGPFFHGKSSMTLTSAMEIAGWKNAGLSFEPIIAPLSFGKSNTNLLIINAFMVPSNASSPDMSCAFIKTALSEEAQKIISSENHFLSVIPSVNQELWDKPHLKSLGLWGSTLDSAQCLYDVIPDSNISLQLESEMELFLEGLESVGSVMPRIQRLFSKYSSLKFKEK